MSRFTLASAVSGFAAACGGNWEPAFRETVVSNVLESVAIADVNDALTFARFEDNGRRRVVAVTRYQEGMIEGVDLSVVPDSADDPISLFRAHGYDGVRDAVRAAPATARVTVPVKALGVPVDLGDHHVAAGTNFPEHADDAGTARPFLFAKLVRPTGAYDRVRGGDGLLDYEVELAFVALDPVAEGAPPGPMGLILCNDYTDRETLMNLVDPRNIESGKGFTTGKSFPGYLPVGNLFVIPRDARAFARAIELRLYVNNGLRQRSKASEMIWDIDEMLAQTWARRLVRWEHRGAQVSLLGDSAAIPARALLMTGTPHGTVFSGVPVRYMASGVLAWLAGGWDQSIESQVIASYVRGARSARAYLQPGDRVAIHVRHMGVIENEVTP